MRKINIIDIFNPTKLRDWLNALLEQGGAQGPKGDSVEYIKSNAVHNDSGGFTTVTVTSKVENNSEQSSSFEVPDGKPGKDGVTVIDAASAGYGLSVKDGKIELGRDEQGIQLVEPPANNGALVFGRIDGNGLYGIIKSSGYISLAEGGASVGIIGETDPAVMDATGAKPLMDGKCRAHMMGYRTTITAESEVFLAGGVTSGQIRAGLTIPEDNKPRAFIDNYDSDASNTEYLIVNKKYLQSEISALVTRLEALEAKP